MLTPKINKVEILENYELLLYFETGEMKIYDMKEKFKYECFKGLKNEKIFNTVKPVGNTIEWETGEDINPEDLYLNSKLITEDEYDLSCYNEAIKEYKKNPKTYTLEEIKRELM